MRKRKVLDVSKLKGGIAIYIFYSIIVPVILTSFCTGLPLQEYLNIISGFNSIWYMIYEPQNIRFIQWFAFNFI